MRSLSPRETDGVSVREDRRDSTGGRWTAEQVCRARDEPQGLCMV